MGIEAREGVCLSDRSEQTERQRFPPIFFSFAEVPGRAGGGGGGGGGRAEWRFPPPLPRLKVTGKRCVKRTLLRGRAP